MYSSSRFNLLVVALIAFISVVTARTVITSQTCATRFCGYAVPQNKIYRTTKTIRKTVPYTVTRWKTKKSTRTVKATKTVTSQRYTTISRVTTVTSEVTVWIGTSTHTRKLTETVRSATLTETYPATTLIITYPVKTIPAPSGFVGVDDDPDNRSARSQPVRTWIRRDEPVLNEQLDRRNAEPEPEPVAANGKYVTAVTCTKTLVTKTGTSDLWKTKTTGTTTKTIFVSTKKVTPPIKTVTKWSTKTVPKTTSKYKVAFASSITTTTLYTTATTFLTTVTSQLPVETVYDSCGPRNRSPRPNFQPYWAAYQAGPDRGENVHVIMSNGTAHDCCVACHTYNLGGVCIGSVWRSTIFTGDPPCWPSTDLEDCDPWEPEFRSKCELVIAASNAPALCRKHTYSFYTTNTEPEAVVSNGLSCQRYKFSKWFI
ncbi:hypothetical protein TWF281_008908 [Arthrobotrys megalospora]